jgi:hypothetical protein
MRRGPTRMHSKPKRSRRVLEPQRLLHSERDIPGFFEQRSRQGLIFGGKIRTRSNVLPFGTRCARGSGQFLISRPRADGDHSGRSESRCAWAICCTVYRWVPSSPVCSYLDRASWDLARLELRLLAAGPAARGQPPDPRWCPPRSAPAGTHRWRRGCGTRAAPSGWCRCPA